MQTWRQRVAAVLDWSEVDKSIFLMLVLIPILAAYLLGSIFLRQMSGSEHLLHFAPSQQLTEIQIWLVLGALLIIAVGRWLRKDHPNVLWLQHIATQYYSLSLVLSSYYIGTMTFCTGVVLLGAPVFGFILLNRHVVWAATIVSTIALLALTYASAFGLIPYAPAVVTTHSQATELIWTTIIFFFTAPHFIVIILFADQMVSYWRNREETIRTLSRTDMLTGLLNRHSIIELLNKEIARTIRHGPPLTVVIIDLDHFKRINDTWGHPAGDMVLKKAAAIFKAQIRQCDMVGRYGGEEFMMILPHTPIEGAAILIERCRATLANTVIIADNGERIAVSGSFGLASNDKQLALTADELIKQADNALYQAKANGRNRVELAK